MSADIHALQDELARLRANLPVLVLAGKDTGATRRKIVRLVAEIDVAEQQVAQAEARTDEAHFLAVQREAAKLAEGALSRVAASMAAVEPPPFPGRS